MRAFMRSGLGLTLALVTFSSLQFGTSPTADSAPSPRRGGTLVYAMSAEASNLDPALRGGNIAEAAKLLAYNGLVK